MECWVHFKIWFLLHRLQEWVEKRTEGICRVVHKLLEEKRPSGHKYIIDYVR
uniref:Uncharacterized protein n=1 Tax=Rhizophora mucronata TaxID=61149 RepID=A0A2P2Q9M4_RHIMU